LEKFKCEACHKFISETEGITTLNGLWVCDERSCRTLDEDNQAIEIISDSLCEGGMKFEFR
jgi:hypothetical protein